jgi:CRISPR-associated protein Csm5
MRLVSAGDSAPIDPKVFKIYLLRTSTLQSKPGGLTLGWKQAPRGTVDGARPDDSTPAFAEMAPPGTSFEGDWQEKAFFSQPEIRRAIRWQDWFDRAKIFEAANSYAAKVLALHKQYAQWTRLDALAASVDALEAKLNEAGGRGACLLPLGWGGGLIGKSAWLDTANPEYRDILRHLSLYNNALNSNLPFPKTRRIVFLNNKPATLPGWALLEIEQ